MKKTFKLEHPKIKVPRIVDSIKHEVRKYLKKERQKILPEGASHWGFDCKLGQTEEAAESIHLSVLTKGIDALVADNTVTIYVEILPRAVVSDSSDEPYDEEG